MADIIKVYQPTQRKWKYGLGSIYFAGRIYYRWLKYSAIELLLIWHYHLGYPTFYIQPQVKKSQPSKT